MLLNCNLTPKSLIALFFISCALALPRSPNPFLAKTPLSMDISSDGAASANAEGRKEADPVALESVGELDQETGFYQSITVLDKIYSKRSKYQDIQIYRTKHFGNALVLDGAVQITERDLDSYNEMMAHTPMFQHKKPRNVLIIGGGDGFVLQEVQSSLFH